MNFLSLNTRYNSTYDWISAPVTLRNLGNNIQNSRNRQYNGQINLTTLYNKVPYFKKINQVSRRVQSRNNSRKEDNFENNKKELNGQYEILKHLTRLVLAVKNVSVNYSLNEGTFIPGYKFQPHFLLSLIHI